MKYIVKNFEKIDKLKVITILGDGSKIKNGTVLYDESGREFLVESVAMKKEMKKTTCIVVKTKAKQVGDYLFTIGSYKKYQKDIEDECSELLANCNVPFAPDGTPLGIWI